MAKALLGHHISTDDRLLMEAARLRQRVGELSVLVDRLQRENDALRAEILLSNVRHPDVVDAAAPTIAG